MGESNISVGIIGAGANTRLLHIPRLQALQNVHVIAVANRTLKSAKKVAKDFGIPEALESWEEAGLPKFDIPKRAKLRIKSAS